MPAKLADRLPLAARTKGLIPYLCDKVLRPTSGNPLGGGYPPVKAELLRKCREDMGLTMAEVARMLNIRENIVLYVEQGERNPHPLVAYGLARIYGLKLKEVLD
jgi:predicted transcriptional regulator